ncbi:hypothetical protein FLAVO9R_30212 [Flavobacterium sp. 9R]|nr:hypothetical protein FLAVO9R_30212 [Flavobacterium sp. 9R]
MKTKNPHLAPMAVASLLGGVRQARYNGQRDDSCGAQECGAPREYPLYFKSEMLCWVSF